MFAVFFFFFFFFFFLFFFLRELIFAKISILPTRCFKQFLCSQRLASTFGKSLSAVFVASSNSAWRDVESVITAISHFSLWSKTLHCWQKLSKSTNQRVYQDLVYRNASYQHSRTSLPSPPLLFIAFFTSHRSPQSERLEQATYLRAQTVTYRFLAAPVQANRDFFLAYWLYVSTVSTFHNIRASY